MAKESEWPIRIEVLEQGIDLTLKNSNLAKKWVKEQQEFWSKIAQALGNQFVLNRKQVNTSQAIQPIILIFSKLEGEISNGTVHENSKTLIDILSAARNMQLVLAGGTIERYFLEAMTENITDLISLVVVWNHRWMKNLPISGDLNFADTIIRSHPATQLLAHLHQLGNAFDAISDSNALAKETVELISRKKEEFEGNLASWQMEMANTKSVYEEFKKLEQPAKYWARRKMWGYGFAVVAFAMFLVVIVGAGYIANKHAADLFAFAQGAFAVDPTQSANQEQKPIVDQFAWLRSFIFFAVPIAAISWTLKHISRVFVQSLAVANDAGLRKALVFTYLSIHRNVGQLDKEDRRLILNALFRPGPDEPRDEGVPLALIEAFRKQP